MNLALSVNHAPLGHMLRHRARHQQLKQAGKKNVEVASIYPLDRNKDHLSEMSSVGMLSQGSVGQKKKDYGLQLPPVTNYKKTGLRGWNSTKNKALNGQQLS